MKLNSALCSVLFTFAVTITGVEVFADSGLDVITVTHGAQVDTISSPKLGTIRLEQPKLNLTAQRVFETMTPAQHARFDSTRLWLLKKLASVLSRSDVAIETAYIEHDNIRIEQNADQIFERDDTPAKKRTRIETILETVHNVLWQNPAAASSPNEHGVMILIGLQAQLGLKSKILKRWHMPEKSIGGAGFLGIQLGYNKDLDKAVIDFRFRTETLYSGAVTNVGLIMRVYPYMRSRDEGSDQDMSGKSSNPPSPPFVGYGFEYSPTYLSVGYNNAWLSLPGEWSSALHYVNEFHEKSLILLAIPTPSSIWNKFRNFFVQKNSFRSNNCRALLQGSTIVYDDIQ